MIAVVDVGIGNPGAVCNVFRSLGRDSLATRSPHDVARADLVVLPGIGAFDAAMGFLRSHGLDNAIRDHAALGRPLLGICLGMQLLGDGSDEGSTAGLGILGMTTVRIPVSTPGLRVPNMGWRAVTSTVPEHADPLVLTGDRFYFAHSFSVARPNPFESATVEHGGPLTAAVQHGSVIGVQFHPEKSHTFGRALISRILKQVDV